MKTVRSGATGSCTPIPAVRKQYSPVEISPLVNRDLVDDSRQQTAKESNPLCECWKLVGHHDSAAYSRKRSRASSAPRTGVEPVSLHRQWSCDAGRITRHSSFRSRRSIRVPGRNRTCVARFRKPVPFHSATRTDRIGRVDDPVVWRTGIAPASADSQSALVTRRVTPPRQHSRSESNRHRPIESRGS